jgi:NAD(P)-dependent dehydrogenase (short-subunit alcohol dehydrogenase family)
MLLADKVAVITGAGRGIGRAIACRFAAEGAAVMLASRTTAEVEEAAKEISAQRARAEWVALDLNAEENCMRLLRAAREHFGGIDILVNNAGIFGPVKPIEEITPAEWDAVLSINLRSAFLLTRFALPMLYARGGGTIVNIASVAAKTAFSWNAPYASSKAGLLALTRSTAAEGARHGVRANALCPGPVPETEMSKELGRAIAERVGRTPAQVLQESVDASLLRRAQSTKEISGAALFLASDLSSAITGQALNVDGGKLFC